jgi:hypothetical protein
MKIDFAEDFRAVEFRLFVLNRIRLCRSSATFAKSCRYDKGNKRRRISAVADILGLSSNRDTSSA